MLLEHLNYIKYIKGFPSTFHNPDGKVFKYTNLLHYGLKVLLFCGFFGCIWLLFDGKTLSFMVFLYFFISYLCPHRNHKSLK